MRQTFYHKITDIYGACGEHYAEHRKKHQTPWAENFYQWESVLNVKGAQGPIPNSHNKDGWIDQSIPTEWRKTTEQDVSNHTRCPDVHLQAISRSVRDMVSDIQFLQTTVQEQRKHVQNH